MQLSKCAGGVFQLPDVEGGIVAEVAERYCGAVGEVDVPEFPAGARLTASGGLPGVVGEPVGVVVEPEPAGVGEPT